MYYTAAADTFIPDDGYILPAKTMQFFAAELTRALDENAYGVRSFLQDGPQAVIVTIEGKELAVQCVNDGFVVCSDRCAFCDFPTRY